MADFNGISGFSPKLVERYGKAILHAVKAGRSLPKEALPVFEARKRSERTPQQDERLKRLKEWRTEKAADLGIDPGIMVNNALLESLSETIPAAPDDLKGLKGWHSALFTDELYNLLIK